MKTDSKQYYSAPHRRAASNIMSIVSEDASDAINLVLDELHSLAPWAAMSLSVYDPLARAHRSVASCGYSKETVSYLDESYTAVDPAYRWIVQTGQSYFSWQTTPFDYSKSISARNWWLPGGYKGGSTSYLTARDNRYVGNLHTSTDDVTQPSPEFLQFIADISPILGVLVDVWQEPRGLLRGLKADECPVFIDFKGSIHQVPGCRSCARADMHDLACRAVRRGGGSNNLSVLGQRLPSVCWHPGSEAVHQVQFKPCDRGWLVVHKAAELPFGLTLRQAEVCSLSAMGLTSALIGSVLQLSARTVDRHIENIFEKTGVGNRIELACFAANAGLVKLEDFIIHAKV